MAVAAGITGATGTQGLDGDAVADVEWSLVWPAEGHDRAGQLVSLRLRVHAVGVVAQVKVQIRAAEPDRFDAYERLIGAGDRL
jgi:hypothetical protein